MKLNLYETPQCVYVDDVREEGIICASGWTDGGLRDDNSHNVYDGTL